MRRKRVVLVVISAAVFASALVVRAVGDPPSPYVRDGDRSAAAFADGPVLTTLQQLVSASNDPTLAVAGFLARPEDELGLLGRFHISLLSHRDGAFTVATYFHVEDDNLLIRTGDYWGRACREYTVVDSHHVTVTPIDCPTGTPQSPYSVDG